MPAGNGDFLFQDTFTASDWRESITEGERRQDTISRVGSSCLLTIICDFSKYKSAIKFILGYSWVDENYFLRRFTPQFHPVWPWLFAKAVTSIQFAKVTIIDDVTTTSGKAIYKLSLNWTNAVPFTVYDYAKITIEFAEVRYDVLADNEMDVDPNPTYGYLEYLRYLETIPQAYTDLVHIDGGQLKAYTPGIPSTDKDTYISAPYILCRQQKSSFKLIWREVPEDVLYDENGFSAKLSAIQKTVNSVTIFGCVPGTLLCESAVGEKNPVPIATDINNRLSFTYDVTFEMKYFNPDPGDLTAQTLVEAYEAASPGSSYGPAIGWNLLPGVRKPTTGGELAWGYYYFTHDGTVSGRPQFAKTDFYSVFRHRSLP